MYLDIYIIKIKQQFNLLKINIYVWRNGSVSLQVPLNIFISQSLHVFVCFSFLKQTNKLKCNVVNMPLSNISPFAQAPSWAFIMSAVGLFIYQSLDAIDGKQARRTNSSSPLGELFDHGCDAVSTGEARLSA